MGGDQHVFSLGLVGLAAFLVAWAPCSVCAFPASRHFSVSVSPIPEWLEWERLLGPGDWEVHVAAEGEDEQHTPPGHRHLQLEARLDQNAAADLSARLRNVGIGGHLLTVDIVPSLKRKEKRAAATDEARRRRERSVGFARRDVLLDEEGRFSLTPEALALEMGERARGLRVIDACAGAGGNAIGFARAGCAVTAIEIDRERLAMARHNAAAYGVGDCIEFVCADAAAVVGELDADLLFVDPPWGGGAYDQARVVLGDLGPAERIIAGAGHVPKIWLKVPPSFDPASLPRCHPKAIFGCGRGDERRVKFLLAGLRGEDVPKP